MQNILLLIILVIYELMGFIVLCLLLSLFLRLFMLYLPVVCPSDIAEQHSITSINNNLSIHALWLELFPG